MPDRTPAPSRVAASTHGFATIAIRAGVVEEPSGTLPA